MKTITNKDADNKYEIIYDKSSHILSKYKQANLDRINELKKLVKPESVYRSVMGKGNSSI